MKIAIASLLLLGAAWGCSGNSRSGAADAGDKMTEPPTPVTLALSPADQAEVSRQMGELAGLAGLTPSDLAARHPVTHGTLGYDPTTATNLDRITTSTLNPTAEELAVLGQQGFVISRRKQFPPSPTGTPRSTPTTCRCLFRPTRSWTRSTARTTECWSSSKRPC